MLARFRPRSIYDVMAALAFFVSVGGGTAFAVVAANQVNSASIIDGQVQNQDLAANSVGTGKIIDHTITGNDLANGAVGSAALADGSVGRAKLADLAVGSAQLDANAVQSGNIGPAQVKDANIDPGTITGDRLAPGTITGDLLAQGTITSREIKLFGIPSSRLAPNSVTHLQLGDRAVGTDEIRSLPGARVGATQNQHIPSVTFQPITFNHEIYDPNNLHTSADTTALKVSVAGRYLITGTVDLTGNSVKDIFLEAHGNGIGDNQISENAGVGSVSTVDALNAGDVVRLGVSCPGGCSSVSRPNLTPILAVQWLTP